MASDSAFLIYPILWVFIPGVIYFVKGFRDFSKKRLIENIPTSKIRSLALGPVEVCGIVVPARGVLTAPYSGEKCVYYKWKAEKLTGGKYKHYETMDSGDGMLAFYLEDDTGKILIDPREAEIKIKEECDYFRKLWHRFPDDLDNFIRSLDMLGYPDRFAEYVIKPGDTLYIMGRPQRTHMLERKKINQSIPTE